MRRPDFIDYFVSWALTTFAIATAIWAVPAFVLWNAGWATPVALRVILAFSAFLAIAVEVKAREADE